MTGSPSKQIVEEGVVTPRTNRSSSAVYVIWTVSVLSVVLIFVFQSFYPSQIGPFSNIITPVIAGSALISSLRCMRKYGYNPRGRFDRVWIYFTLGMASWTLAEITWGVYYFVLNIPVPYPSVADWFYIGAYIPLSLALLTYFFAFRAGMTRKKLAISFAAIASSTALVLALVLPTEFAKAQPLVTTLTDLIYPILDLLLLSLAILSVSLFVKGKLSRWWSVLSFAIVFDIVGDELFLYQSAQGTYYNGSFDDIFYVVAYFLFALAFYIHSKEL